MYISQAAIAIICTIITIFSYSNKLLANTINVAVAANMLSVSKVISENFTQKTGIKVNIISSSSGKLYQQIVNGAPYHIFISADLYFPDKLVQQNYTIGKTKEYAKGILVLWFNKNVPIKTFKDLSKVYNKHSIALANPKVAPYGDAAISALKYIKIYDKIQHKLIISDSINQVNQLITTKNIDIAFTSKSFMFNEAIKNIGTFIKVPKNHYTPISQGMVLLKYSSDNQKNEAKQFYNFIFSKYSKNLMKKNGYIVN